MKISEWITINRSAVSCKIAKKQNEKFSKKTCFQFIIKSELPYLKAISLTTFLSKIFKFTTLNQQKMPISII